MSSTVSINGKTINPGQRAQINLNVARLPTHTLIDLPVYVYRGNEEGPGLLVTAGLHGDELNGIETIRRMIVSNTLVPDAGTVIALPIVNIYGFLHNSRYLPDGRDLNRSFPGSSSGSLAARIAYTLMNKIVPLADVGVDFHTGGPNRNYPHIRCDFNEHENLTLARAFSPPYIMNSRLRDSSFRKAAHKAGKTILVFEGGESHRFDELAVTEAMDGIMRMMTHLGMADRKPSKINSTRELSSTVWIRAGLAGLFRSYVEYGQAVKKNQVIASVTDPFGETEAPIRSRVSGYVLGLRSLPVVNRGDALINIGLEQKAKKPPKLKAV